MNTFVLEDESVRIPDGISDLAAFRRWIHSDEFPETGRICYLNGNVWVDMSQEQLFSHNQVKSEFNIVIGGLVRDQQLGCYFPDGAFLTNEAANLSCQPDATFVSPQSVESKRVRLVEGKMGGFVEIEGTPDMVLEVVSASSVGKDTEVLRELYWRAQIPEYWLVDARAERLEFEIFRLASSGYTATRKQAGWVRSRVFGCSARLTRKMNPLGQPACSLSIR